MTLSEFLAARIVDDLELAQVMADIADDLEAGYHGWAHVPTTEGAAVAVLTKASQRMHVECEAKRAILDLSEHGCGDDYQRVQYALALPYADHPDYRQEWRP